MSRLLSEQPKVSNSGIDCLMYMCISLMMTDDDIDIARYNLQSSPKAPYVFDLSVHPGLAKYFHHFLVFYCRNVRRSVVIQQFVLKTNSLPQTSCVSMRRKKASVITFHITVYVIKTFTLVWERENSDPVKPNVIHSGNECLLHCGVFFLFFFLLGLGF